MQGSPHKESLSSRFNYKCQALLVLLVTLVVMSILFQTFQHGDIDEITLRQRWLTSSQLPEVNNKTFGDDFTNTTEHITSSEHRMSPLRSTVQKLPPEDVLIPLHTPDIHKRTQPVSATNMYNYCKPSWYSIVTVLGPLNRQFNAKDNIKPDPPSPKKTVVKCRTLEYMSPPGPLTALASFPGSGNTWVRHLLQQATGKLTGAVYLDLSLKNHGFPAEGIITKKVIAVKTHHYGLTCKTKYDRAILLIRHPAGAVMAEFNRQASLPSHSGKAHPALFNSKHWPSFVDHITQNWRDFNNYWIRGFPGELLIVQYESLKENITFHLKRMTDFLEMEIPEEAFFCTVNASTGVHKRSHTNQEKDHFTPTMIKVINQAVSHVNELFNR